jgi:hypothetical protein
LGKAVGGRTGKGSLGIENFGMKAWMGRFRNLLIHNSSIPEFCNWMNHVR